MNWALLINGIVVVVLLAILRWGNVKWPSDFSLTVEICSWVFVLGIIILAITGG